MRITKDKARENRERVVAEAGRLFRQKGFEGVGVAELMRAAGLTHGGFYNHFDSKEAVEAAACDALFANSIARIEAVASLESDSERRAAFDAYRRRYVSPEARDAPGPACPMAAFAADMSRQSGPARASYARGLRAYLEAFERAGGGDRGEAMRAFFGLVGALTLARSVAAEDPELSTEILEAAIG